MWLRWTPVQRLWRSFFSNSGGGGGLASNFSELKAWCRAGDMPCLNHLTWLVMPATRPDPLGLSETEMCAEHSRECINLLFIKCGVTWDWWLNGDLCWYNRLHEAVTWLVWAQHMDNAECVKDCGQRVHCRACQSKTLSVTVKCLTRISCSSYFRDFHEATGGTWSYLQCSWRKKNQNTSSSTLLDLRLEETR